MACAKKCDRCGKLYEQYNSKNDRKNPNGIMVLNLDSQRRYFAHNALDLCPDCMKGFQGWFGEVKQMERLTYSGTREANNAATIREIINKLCDYENAEEQGLLVRLPCKVGDTMYDIVGKPLRIVEHKVDAFHIDKKGFHLQIIDGVLEKKQEAKVYFSREEAEKKMEERKNEI